MISVLGDAWEIVYLEIPLPPLDNWPLPPLKALVSRCRVDLLETYKPSHSQMRVECSWSYERETWSEASSVMLPVPRLGIGMAAKSLV